MAFAAAAPDRERLYQRLARRNLLVLALRWLVPMLGLLLLVVLVVQIVLDNLEQQLGFASLSIDRNQLVLEGPHLTSMGEDGVFYELQAGEARAALDDPDRVELQRAELAIRLPEGATYTARSEQARLQLDSQQLTTTGITTIAGADGMAGRLTDLSADYAAKSLVTGGAAEITYPDGTTISGERLSYDGATRLWIFDRAVVTLPYTPGEKP